MQYLADKTSASLQAAAVFIAAVIRFRTQVLVNQPALPTADFHSIESKNTGHPYSLCEGSYYMFHAATAHCFTSFISCNRVNTTGSYGIIGRAQHTCVKQLWCYTTRNCMHSSADSFPQTQRRAAGEMRHIIINSSRWVVHCKSFSYDEAEKM